MKTNYSEADVSDDFEFRLYRKQELAMRYFPELSKECAGRNLRRWIQHCQDLVIGLQDLGYDKHRKFFSKQEVRLIVQHLGEP